jgi:hypothetical protein
MNKLNKNKFNMKSEIKAGDTVICINTNDFYEKPDYRYYKSTNIKIGDELIVDEYYEEIGNYYSSYITFKNNVYRFPIDSFKLKEKNKKLIGYTFARDVPNAKKGVAISLKGVYLGTKGDEYEYNVELLSDVTWFTPVYEELKLKIKEKTLIVGNNDIELTLVKGKNLISIKNKKEELNIDYIRRSYEALAVPYSLGDFNIQIKNSQNKEFRVGCVDENNLVSLDELRLVIDEWKKLNNND